MALEKNNRQDENMRIDTIKFPSCLEFSKSNKRKLFINGEPKGI